MRHTRKLEQFLRFAELLHSSTDIDPVYPVLKELYRYWELSPVQSLWVSALYLGYYHLGSALKAYSICSTSRCLPTQLIELCNLPIGMERRGLRGGHIEKYLAGCSANNWPNVDAYKTLDTELLTENYTMLRAQVRQLPYIGPWAAFKWLELLREVHEQPLVAPHMFLHESSGPLAGLEIVMDISRDDLIACERAAEELQRITGYSWERLETCLCDFHSYTQGRYRIGMKIAKMLTEMKEVLLEKDVLSDVMKARRQTLNNDYLTECWTLDLGR